MVKNYLILLLAIASISSCKKKNDEKVDPAMVPEVQVPGNGYSGYIYSSTNATSGNGIIAMGRKSDGTLTELENSPYPTGNNGDAMDGDFDAQNALRISGDFLLAVNAGGNPVNGSISVFKINRTTGSLTQVDQDPSTATMDNMDSRGVRSVSIATTIQAGITFVLVANQFANPNFQMDPAVAHGSVTSTDMRNLAVFTFNQSNGILTFSKIGATYNDGSNGGPTTVEFNKSGTKMAVSTWGVAHFMTPDADLTKQKPGRLYIYDFMAGNLTKTGMYEEAGVSGNIGISWSPNDQYIYMTNFNLHSTKEDNSVTVHDGITAAKVQNFATGERNDEACWTWVSLDKQKLYTASFSGNIVSVFDITGDGKLAKSLTTNYFMRSGGIPMGDTKDLFQVKDGYLYASGAYQSHKISIFKMAPNGSLTEISGSPYAVPKSIGKTKDEQSFLGLTGFDK